MISKYCFKSVSLSKMLAFLSSGSVVVKNHLVVTSITVACCLGLKQNVYGVDSSNELFLNRNTVESNLSNSAIACVVSQVTPSSLSFSATNPGSGFVSVVASELQPVLLRSVLDSKTDIIIDDPFQRCTNWIYSTSASWLTILKSSSGLTIIPQSNSGASRSATITIGGDFIVTVTQAGNCTPPTITSVTSGRSCGTASVSISATPSAGSINWYSAASGGNILATGNTYNTPVISSTTTYYAEAVNNGCKSTLRRAVTATINPKPAKPTTYSWEQEFCGTTPLSSVYAIPPSGSVVEWYNNPIGGSALLGTVTLPYNNTTYYAQSKNTTTGCVSTTRTAVNTVAFEIPEIELGASQSFCSSAKISSIDYLAGTDVAGVMWYLGDQLLTENTLLTTNTYKAIAFNHQDMGACVSNPYFINITINSPPSPPSAPAQQVVLAGSTISNLATTPPSGCSVQWFTSASGGYPLPSGTLLTNGKYYAGSKINTSGCISTSRTLVNVTIDHYVAPIATSTSNYIHQITPQVEMNISTLKSALTGGSAIQTLKKGDIANVIQYYDKLGRPSQLVNFASSPTGKDIIQVTAYDNYGRESTKYLPYTNQATGGYRTSASSEQQNFYTNTSSDVVVDAYPFAKLIYENMPGGRVVEQGAPGASWQPLSGLIAGSGHTAKSNYTFNSSNEVICWCVENNELKYSNFYIANELRLTEYFDENSNRTREYKDKYNRLVLRSVRLDQETEAKTYYVYDDYGQLRYVLSPMFTQSMGEIKQFLPNHSLVKQFAYYYMYDTRGRIVVKQLPGAEAVFMVYDPRDRLVMLQDGNMRSSNKWEFTKYDALNRPVLKGIQVFNWSREQAQMNVDIGYEDEVFLYYEELGNSVLGYTNNSFPFVSTLTSYISVTYYDSYSAITATNGFSGLGFSATHNISGYVDGDGISNGYFDHIKGQIAGQRVKVLDGNEHTTSAKWLSTVKYYNNKYQVIQVVRNTYPSGTEFSSSKYSFVDLVLETRVYQSLGTATQRNVNTYDHAGRLTKTVQTVTKGSATKTETLAEQQYNELGQLKTKKMANGVQQMVHSYNIRGWLKSINNISTTPTNTKQFALSLQYESNGIGAQPQYNGNISAMQWRMPSGTGAISTSIQGYAYTYDGMNRMLTATYAQGATGTSNKNLYNESVGAYDLNGNILSLSRSSANGSVTQMDNIYSGNQLIYNGEDGYKYDHNGNMTFDGLRGFSVEYNELNLPRRVALGADYVRYIYDATGTKLAQIAYSGGVTETINYQGGFIYSGTTLDFILTGEGRAIFNSATNTFTYEYHLKDHLGNTRVATASSGAVNSSSFYYPFGLTLKEINAQGSNSYLYNGKEQQDVSLNGIMLGWYDYGARFYDPAIARWSAGDPLAEKNRRWSPYAYAYNNPVRFIDPDGMCATDYDGNYMYDEREDKYKHLEVSSVTIIGGSGESITLGSDGAGEEEPPKNKNNTGKESKKIKPQGVGGKYLEPHPLEPKERLITGYAPAVGTGVPSLLRGLVATTAFYSTWTGHANSHKNPRNHGVYMIFSIPKGHFYGSEGMEILKYGISDISVYGERRPQSQVNLFQSKDPSRTYDYIWMQSMIKGRIAAKLVEQYYVTEYYLSHDFNMPRFQYLPLP